jgi:hypothetical protein
MCKPTRARAWAQCTMFLAATSCRGVVGRTEASMDLVVDHADVLHERVHATRPDEAVPLRLQLLRERFRPSRTDDSHRVIHGSPFYSDAKR